MRDLKRKIGQLFVIGISGAELTEEEKKLIEEYNVGGIIFFKRNFKKIAKLIELVNDINLLDIEAPFLSVDQEGGEVIRFGKPFTQFPDNSNHGKYYEQTKKLDLIREYARVNAKELKACGINLCFAPVLDVLTNPKNKVIGKRSFSSDAEVVADLGSVVIEEFRNAGLLSCAKHFPGHGDTMLDSHKELPKINHDLKFIEKRELIPFKRAIEKDVPSIMTSHILYESIDSQYPITLSEKALSGLLRDEMGYKNIIIADDFDMYAISKRYSMEEASSLAFKAGVDSILLCHSFLNLPKVVEYIESEALKNEKLNSRLNEAYNRINNFKSSFNKTTVRLDIKEIEKTFDAKTSSDLVSRIKSYA